jgi:hypothetical protein
MGWPVRMFITLHILASSDFKHIEGSTFVFQDSPDFMDG